MEHQYYSSFSLAAEQALTWISSLFFILLCSLIFLQISLRRRPKLNRPPGPRPFPIIGNLNRIGPKVHHSIHALAMEYGPLMQLWFGSEPVVVASSVEMAHAFLRTHDQAFAARPVTSAGKYTAYNFSDMVWSSYGPYWRQARKIFSSELFTNKRLESYLRVEERDAFLRVLFLSKGKPVTLKDHVADLTINITIQMVLGKKYPKRSSSSNDSLGDDYTSDDIRELIDEWIMLNGVVNLGDLIPWLGFFDLQGYVKKMKACAKKVDRFLEHAVNEHIERRKTQGPEDFVAKDMVDQLLLHLDDGTNSNNVEVKLERCQVKGLTWDLVVGATETTIGMVEWALSELLKNPEILKKATEELDRVIGKNRWVEESDRVNLHYIDAITKETMRLHPIAPLLIPRFTTQDIKIGGYDIPKGTRGLVSSWTLARDPKLWDNPEEFYPDRFIEKNIDVNGQDLKFMPFGSGRRMCPGYSPSFKVIQSTLANLLHGFRWELPSGVRREDLDMDDVFGISTPMKTPLVAVAAEARLPPHLYSPSM